MSPRVHVKAVIVDGAFLYLGRAKFESLWRDGGCDGCRLRDACEMPLDAIDESGVRMLERSREGDGERLRMFRVSPKPNRE